jgi:hypothetical protein
VIPSLTRRTAIAFLSCLTLIVTGCHRVPDAASEPQPAADAFFSTLEAGNARAAYDGSAFGFQASQTFDAFRSNAEDLGFIGGQPPQWSEKDIQDTQATLKGTLVNHIGDPISISVTLTKDDGMWKLFSLQIVNTAAGETENRFTTVGKGAGFNDVYHQPIPDPKQLDTLVRKTMALLADAIRRDDFQAFYDSISREWKVGHRSDGTQMGGVTPTILKNHFQGFVDKKIDLTNIADLKPVYEQPPYIDPNGLLDARGHFDRPPTRVEFSFGYVYELPWWKLVSIDVGIREQ